MNGILYFSSTGNSLWIAKKIKEKFGGKVLYIPNYVGNGEEFDKIFLITPIYSYGMPTFVYDLLPSLNKTSELIIIENYGGMVLGADTLIYNYAKKYKLNIKAVYVIQMPENYTLFMTIPKFYLTSILKKSTTRLNKIISQIENKQYRIPKQKKTKEKVYLKNKANWHLIGNSFHCNENCIKCGKCIKLCPSHNIFFKDGKITFGDNCVACLGCYHRCPQHAIIYKNKNKSFRYINPNINEKEIGSDF